MRWASLKMCFAALVLLSGCVMFEVGVTNPVAGLTTVAIAPFFNLSEERSVDGRRFAQAYFAELQKTPGFQVIPVGVTEQAIHDFRLQMNNPDDALRLATILNVDAVVIGAVTDYSPYYPPRVGLQVSWYSPKAWQFSPGVPVNEWGRDLVKPRAWWDWWGKPRKTQWPPPNVVPPPPVIETVRGQSPVGIGDFLAGKHAIDIDPPPPAVLEPPQAIPPDCPVDPTVMPIGMPFDPRQPLMSYTRLFDGADPKLTARLRDYVELHGDLRSGGWEAYLSRSEDFIRFTAHVMIVEMLQLHGGEAQKRVVLKHRHWQ